MASIQTLRDYLRNTIKPLLDELIRRISANLPDLLREINQVVVQIETVLLPQISTAISTGFGLTVSGQLAIILTPIGAIQATLVSLAR